MLLGYHSDGASYDVRGTLGAAPHFAASLKVCHVNCIHGRKECDGDRAREERGILLGGISTED